MRTATSGVLAAACLGLSALWFVQPGVARNSWEVATAQQQERAIKHEIDRARRDAFASFLDQVNEQIADGRTSLEQARNSVLAYSETYYPNYLDHVMTFEPGATLEEKIARNLVRYFRTADASEPRYSNPALRTRLEQELQTLVNAARRTEKRYTVQ